MEFSNRKFGVEIEFKSLSGYSLWEIREAVESKGLTCRNDGYNHHDSQTDWKLVPDSSCGYELVSPILSGEDGLHQIELACEALNSVGVKVDKSCGLHVHVDARDLSQKDIGKVFVAYARWERLFDALMPESRRANNNTYCSGIERAYQRHKEDFVKNPVVAYHNHIGTRYVKVNLTSVVAHGSIEFRQHSGTTSAEKIINWVVLMVGFVDETSSRYMNTYAVKMQLSAFKKRYGISDNSEDTRIAAMSKYLNLRIKEMSGLTLSRIF